MKSTKALVVDDNYLNIRLLTDILEDEGFDVRSTMNPQSAVELAHLEKPDIILLDVMMPGLDGFEVCRLLKNDFEIKDIPVIMVTAKTQSIDVKHALEAGAFDYIKKPIDEIEVVARVESAIRFKQQQDTLKEMAMKDGLTGVYNHALLMELLGKEYEKHLRSGRDLCFIMLDIDHFKKVNDTYGHTAGDVVLKELSKILTTAVRQSDIVGRYGGEEFGIILPEVDENTVYLLCERIRKSVECHRFNINSNRISITISAGAFVKKQSSPVTASEMVKKADVALYMAKSDGRNRVKIIKI